ncbi:MAG: Lrp/AsnC family transcriptional regulator, leucine-responsive regulatory protein [Actinomycetota bacterium]|jgi:Lrp/AsnC family leucine-responsive transcriptional regulator|nr:Lrp/AsnC family transcriptional regulator, leucine-responsive regulatory protein [Actinomycetota bacterium]MEA2487213.1 Lrp/AsnC family transcriptional regulator, leucine-responsive regulatory protein [Actinomycetota bacterium]
MTEDPRPLDRVDRMIVAELERDARATYAEVGARVGLAASSVHDRVRKLERSGVIGGYRAEIDYDGVGLPITAFVSLALRPGSPPDIPSRIGELPLVESCYSVAGDNSYVIIVRAPDTKALEDLLDALRAKLEVVTRSTIVLSTPFERRPMVTAEPTT